MNQPNVDSDKFESDAELKAFQYRAYDSWQRRVDSGIDSDMTRVEAILEADSIIASLRDRMHYTDEQMGFYFI